LQRKILCNLCKITSYIVCQSAEQIVFANSLTSPGKKKTAGYPVCSEALYGKPCFDLAMSGDGFPSGWVLLKGSLIRRGGDYDARLYYDLGKGFKDNQYVEIPSSSKGVINELIFLPTNIKRLKFSPMGTKGEFELGPLSFSDVGSIERVWRMVRRVISMIFLHSDRTRKVINLTLFQMLADLQRTYKIASKLRAHAVAPQYQDWSNQFDELSDEDRVQINKHISRFAYIPHFHLLVVMDGTVSGAVQKTLDSLNKQLYSCFSCVLLDTVASDTGLFVELHGMAQKVIRVDQSQRATWLAQFNASLAGSNTMEWMMLVRAGDVFAPHALYRFACEVLAKPGAAVLYSDDDVLDEKGQRCKPRFKPDWSLTHFRSTNYVGDAVALRGDEVAKAGGVNMHCCRHGSYDLMLRVIDVVGETGVCKVAHVPEVLLHHDVGLFYKAEIGSIHADWNSTQWNMEALRRHLIRNGVLGGVSETLPDCWQIRFQLPEVPPLVSIIIPTRDALELIRLCMGSLLERTSYPCFEVLIVDNQSADPEVLAYLDQIAEHENVRVLRYNLPFNYSAMNNMAACEARGDVMCLLNNDTEVISPNWLDEMVGHLLQPKVGVVGAKLYFPNGQVQHGGDLVGVGGVANHAHAFLQRGDPGYCNRAVVAQEHSAVTAACLVTWKDIFQRLGGLNEINLKVAFNDVDYCLRAREAGYHVVWTPHAELYHYESVSRGKNLSPEKKRRADRETAYMRKRWGHVMQNDPFYNPNLSYVRPDFSLSHAPLVDRPWQS